MHCQAAPYERTQVRINLRSLRGQNDHRSDQRPLLVGGPKARLGAHTEPFFMDKRVQVFALGLEPGLEGGNMATTLEPCCDQWCQIWLLGQIERPVGSHRRVAGCMELVNSPPPSPCDPRILWLLYIYLPIKRGLDTPKEKPSPPS